MTIRRLNESSGNRYQELVEKEKNFIKCKMGRNDFMLSKTYIDFDNLMNEQARLITLKLNTINNISDEKYKLLIETYPNFGKYEIPLGDLFEKFLGSIGLNLYDILMDNGLVIGTFNARFKQVFDKYFREYLDKNGEDDIYLTTHLIVYKEHELKRLKNINKLVQEINTDEFGKYVISNPSRIAIEYENKEIHKSVNFITFFAKNTVMMNTKIKNDLLMVVARTVVNYFNKQKDFVTFIHLGENTGIEVAFKLSKELSEEDLNELYLLFDKNLKEYEKTSTFRNKDSSSDLALYEFWVTLNHNTRNKKIDVFEIY